MHGDVSVLHQLVFVLKDNENGVSENPISITGDHPMKKTILALAMLSVLPLAAQAQTNVTIYGVADASINRENTGNDKRVAITSGNQSTSRIGFRGTEDLGNGLKALFNIEAGVAIDTGAADAAGLFQRRAVIGLQGSFGTVT